MENSQIFRERVQELYRRAQPYKVGKRPTQRDLAEAIGLSQFELSNRLNGTKGKSLSERDIRSIVRTLVEWDTIQSQAEALELLALLACTPFTPAEWQAPPLDLLKPLPGGVPIATNLSIHARPHGRPRPNLPKQQSSFIGRSQELTTLSQLLADNRLLTITGAGGVGKSRLALALAEQVQAQFSGGVLLVELASLSEPGLVWQAVAVTLGVREQTGQELADSVLNHLQDQELLLVLDNCEHLIGAVAQLCNKLLRGCPSLKVLATSREPLDTGGEMIWALAPLLTPRLTGGAADVGELSQYHAVQLFVERSQQVLPTFGLTEDNADTVRTICYRLDGIPLAIELAAALTAALGVAEINRRLDERFALLSGGRRGANPQQQTLRASMSWSYNLLSEAERTLLCRLSVFVGRWGLAACEQVCAGGSLLRGEVIHNLVQLVNKSLVMVEMQNGENWYRLLETVRHYAQEELVARGEQHEWQRSYALYYLNLAETADPLLRGAQQTTWVQQLEDSYDNLRAVLQWSLQHEQGHAIRLGSALCRFWYMHSHFSEGRAWIDAILNLPVAGQVVQQVRLLSGAGTLAWCQGEIANARHYYEQCLSLSEELGDVVLLANALNNLALAVGEEDAVGAWQLHLRSLKLRRAAGDRVGIATTLNNLALLTTAAGDYAAARELHLEALAISRELGDYTTVAATLSNLGMVAAAQGDYATARELYEESLEISRDAGHKLSEAHTLDNLANVASSEGLLQLAQRYWTESLRLFREVGDKLGVIRALNNQADLLHSQAKYQQAGVCYRESLAANHDPVVVNEQARSRAGLAVTALAQGEYAPAPHPP